MIIPVDNHRPVGKKRKTIELIKEICLCDVFITAVQASSTITNTLYNELSSYNELFAVAQSQLPFAVHFLSAITNFLL